MAEGNTAGLPTGLYWKDKKTEVERIALPFQTVEVINESRATREKQKGTFLTGTSDPSWYNRLIWGDNKYVMASLLNDFAGKIDLIYIDPPFATGADFSINVEVGDLQWIKEPSAIEDKAYRDTWARGTSSYLQMIYERLTVMNDLLAPDGSIYVHVDDHLGHYVKIVLDNLFGKGNFRNQIIWRRSAGHSDAHRFGRNHDMILFYTKGERFTFNPQWGQITDEEEAKLYPLVDESGRRYILDNLAAKGVGPPRRFGNQIIPPPRGRHWAYSQENIDRLWDKGMIVITGSGVPRFKRYADSTNRMPVQDIWVDCIRHISTVTTFPTEKPEKLLTRIISASSNEGDLVADFFCGSGTTGAVAEKLQRRWIMADLSRYAIHVTRKRMLAVDQCKPFAVQNLGKYERQYWQGITFSKRSSDQLSLYEYVEFIITLYHAQPISGMMHIHGKKGRRLVHVGAVDAPVTLSEIKEAVAEVKRTGQDSLDILGWEWELGLHDVAEKEARTEGVHLRLFSIPRDVMDPRAVEKGDITFYELAYVEVEPVYDKHNNLFFVELKDFAIPNLDLIPGEVRGKIKKWSDYIDYWAVDWDWNQDTFHNMWQSYRTRKDRTLQLKTDGHTYDTKGDHLVMIKVIDIFGNDTTTVIEVKN